MNGLVFRLPLLCLVQMSLGACGAAGETPGMGETNGPSTTGTVDGATDGPLLLGNPPATATPDDSETDGGDAGEVGDGNGGEPTPGVDVAVDEHGITVLVALPDGGAIKIATQTGSCSTTGTGVDIEGDVTIDLGTGLPLPLADANLHVEVGGGMPTLSGAANVSGSLLDGIGCGCVQDSLPVAVSLDTGVELNGSSDALAIALNLAMNDLVIDTSTLPLGSGATVLGDTDVTIKSDGEHRWLSVVGAVTIGTKIWTSTVPLAVSSPLTMKATVADGALLAVQLRGSVTLEGGKLWCGITPLRQLTLPDALITLDHAGLSLHATAQASAHPGFSVAADALVDGRFTSEAWSLTVCADVMTDIISASVRLGQCVGMTPGGAEVCDCHRDDEGHCDGGGV